MKTYIVKMQCESIPYQPSEKEIQETIDLLKNGICMSLPKNDSIPTFALIDISEETFNFLNSICNIELDSFGKKFYVCNKIRMEIEEK